MSPLDNLKDRDRGSQLIRSLGDDTSLNILVWGPGATAKSRWRQKRKRVIQALRESSSSRDEIHTSEELFAASSIPPGLDLGRCELIHANEADIIIVLVLASPSSQGGVFRELDIIGAYEDLRDKTWIFLPSDTTWEKRFVAGALKLYRESHKIRIPWARLKECVRLREMCVAKVEEERKQRMYRKLEAMMSQML